jgi:hypothetical protein
MAQQPDHKEALFTNSTATFEYQSQLHSRQGEVLLMLHTKQIIHTRIKDQRLHLSYLSMHPKAALAENPVPI